VFHEFESQTADHSHEGDRSSASLTAGRAQWVRFATGRGSGTSENAVFGLQTRFLAGFVWLGFADARPPPLATARRHAPSGSFRIFDVFRGRTGRSGAFGGIGYGWKESAFERLSRHGAQCPPVSPRRCRIVITKLQCARREREKPSEISNLKSQISDFRLQICVRDYQAACGGV
jgi:hypothetical protein